MTRKQLFNAIKKNVEICGDGKGAIYLVKNKERLNFKIEKTIEKLSMVLKFKNVKEFYVTLPKVTNEDGCCIVFKNEIWFYINDCDKITFNNYQAFLKEDLKIIE